MSEEDRSTLGANLDPLVPEDLRRIVTLVLDLSFYRREHVQDLGYAAWTELRDAVSLLPEARF